jgi:[ribosomal protein S18]-alanine N-acetyltransferase
MDEMVGSSSHPKPVPAPVDIRRMNRADVPALLSILGESPEASMWSEQGLLRAATKGEARVAVVTGVVVGMLFGQVAADELEILNLAIAKEYRRRGIARRLVEAALLWARSKGAGRAYLEVRASNRAGIAFYTKMGFRECGRRPNYYRAPPEDAVLLALR